MGRRGSQDWFQSTLPTRGSDQGDYDAIIASVVSIHAPHEGERPAACLPRPERMSFNPRSPRGGATGVGCCEAEGCAFQSTLPTRGSDRTARPKAESTGRFNPRSPRGGATAPAAQRSSPSAFQSTLPTRGSDSSVPLAVTAFFKFQSTLPTRGSDCDAAVGVAPVVAFQSTLPTRGSDGVEYLHCAASLWFQSTLPTRGSDVEVVAERVGGFVVSIHAPHEGERLADGVRRGLAEARFNPRSPRGGATQPRRAAHH